MSEEQKTTVEAENANVNSTTQENPDADVNANPEVVAVTDAAAEMSLNTINALDLAGQANKVSHSSDNQAPSNQALNVSGTSLNSNETAMSLSYEKELARLRGLIKEKDEQLSEMEKRVSESETAARMHSERLNQQFSAKLEESIRALKESSQRDKNSMVMKYVEGEKKCIELNRHIELLQAKLSDASKEKQRMEERIQTIRAEMDKLNGDNDKRLKDMMSQKKEMDRLKEQLILNDAREKASQLKLVKEIEAHLLTRKQLEAANSEIIQLKNQEPISVDANDNNEIENSSDKGENQISESNINGIKATNEDRGSSPNPESSTSDTSPLSKIAQQTSTKQVQSQPQPTQATTERNDKAIRELAALRSQLKDMFEERTTLRDRLQCMEQERKLQEMNLSKYKETLQSQKQMNKDLLDEILQLRESKETLENIQNEKKQLEARLASLTAELNELQVEMKQSQEKQNELLSFTAKLTEKNTQLQSENTVLKEKLQQIETYFTDSNRTLREANENLKLEVESVGKSLIEKIQNLDKLEKELKEAEKANDELKTKLSDERDELNTLKKKHAANIKDLTKQLQSLQKRATSQAQNTSQSLDQSKASSSGAGGGCNGSSRENSVNSLSAVDKELSSIGASTNWAGERDIDEDRFSLESSSNIPSFTGNHASTRYQHEVLCDGVASSLASDDVYVFDIDKQKLIDKIVKLQKKLAKANEKTDFMQDHVNQLTNDLKKKTRIIQAYAIKEDAGAFTSEAQDAIKREMSKKTGIMSTLYNTHKSYVQTANFIKSHESNMTMELCLEINSKLQALLEDILIKNITLKESLETLGTEVARLSKENRQLKLNE